MSHVDATDTRFIDLSIRPGLVGYMDSASLISDVARDLGLSGLRDAANDSAEAISARHAALRHAVVEPSADEWDDALQDADWRLDQLESQLFDETEGAWIASAYEGFYVIASSDWWNALKV